MPAMKCIEVLPAQKSSPHNALTFHPGDRPGAGTLVVDTSRGRTRTSYAVEPVPTGWDGRGFRLTKRAGGTDPEAGVYDVFACRRGADHSCDCKGFVFGRGRPCKHLLAVLALIENRWV